MCLGIPGRVCDLRTEQGLLMGTVDFGGARQAVCLAYLPESAAVGEYVIVHVGFAIAKLDEDAARRTLAMLGEMSRLGEVEMTGSDPSGAVEP